MISTPEPQPRPRISPLAFVFGLTIAVTVFAGLIAAWMYWLAVLV